MYYHVLYKGEISDYCHKGSRSHGDSRSLLSLTLWVLCLGFLPWSYLFLIFWVIKNKIVLHMLLTIWIWGIRQLKDSRSLLGYIRIWWPFSILIRQMPQLPLSRLYLNFPFHLAATYIFTQAYSQPREFLSEFDVISTWYSCFMMFSVPLELNAKGLS